MERKKPDPARFVRRTAVTKDGEAADQTEYSLNIEKIEETFRLMKTDFKVRPVHLSREDRIKAHFLTCYLALLISRILEKKLGGKYTSGGITRTLRSMYLCDIEGSGYIPTYTRTELTDDLHDVFGFNTDTQIIKKAKMRSIIKKTKEH